MILNYLPPGWKVDTELAGLLSIFHPSVNRVTAWNYGLEFSLIYTRCQEPAWVLQHLHSSPYKLDAPNLQYRNGVKQA